MPEELEPDAMIDLIARNWFWLAWFATGAALVAITLFAPMPRAARPRGHR